MTTVPVRSSIITLASEADGKVALLVAVSSDLTKTYMAGKIVGEMAKLVGGGGANVGIEVLQDGRYEFFARYSSFDIFQPGLPGVDGTKFLRIIAATNGVKQCILQDLIVPTALNGEANVTGGGFMDLSAGDIFGIIGFHTGATGGAGNQGFPVSNNAFFNEPMLWLVKID